jgi:TM2 domain-containing membrane protein YozV
MKSTVVAYLLWLGCFIALCGLHRFYAGKIFTGIIWLLTVGLMGFGQFIDLFLIPGMIENANLKLALYARGGLPNTGNVVIHVVHQK